MKQSRIYMKRWLAANERSKQVPTDTWYLHFASQLLLLIDHLHYTVKNLKRKE